MNFKVFTRFNKILNTISVFILPISVFSMILSASFAPDWWHLITLGLFTIGILFLVINWLSTEINKVLVSAHKISHLKVNSSNRLFDIKEVTDIEYYGNFLKLKDENRLEIHRKHVLELINKIEVDKIEVTYTGQKFHNISPKQLLSGLLNIGP